MNDPQIPGISPYPSYKATMASRVDQAPEHWDVVPLSAVARVKSVVNKPHLQLLSVYLNEGVILFSEAEERRTNPTSEDLSKYQVVDPSDLVLNNQQAWRGSVGVSRHCGIVSPAYLVLSLNSRLTQKFAELLFRDRMMVDQYLVASKGVGTIQRNLYWPHLKRATTIIPPLEEQAAIVRYLDDADQRIRAYVSAKERLIALMEETRQVLIQQAVTRGLDPNVRLKPSVVEWLGEIPELWEVRKLKQVCSQHAQYGANIPASEYTTSGLRFLRTTDITEKGHLTGEGVYIPIYLSPEHILKDGDILLSRSGTIGRSFQYQSDKHGPCSYAGYLVRFVPNVEMFPRFIYLFTLTATFRHSVQQAAIASTIENVNAEKYANIHLPVPPLNEQICIVEELDKTTKKIDTVISCARRQIEFMEEYRTRLIAEVITGKLDVREAAGQLPDPDGEDPLTEHQSLSNPTINVTL